MERGLGLAREAGTYDSGLMGKGLHRFAPVSQCFVFYAIFCQCLGIEKWKVG